MVIRESVIGRGLSGAGSAVALFFAALLAAIGDKATSKQWTYLMGVPGRKWFWATLFVIAGVVIAFGILMRWHRLTAIGLFVGGAACGLIAAFYLMAPLIDPGLLTLGYVTWAVNAGLAFTLAVWNWKPTEWF